MFRRRGVTLTKALLSLVCLLAATQTQAISVGNLTFSLPAEMDFASKRVVNNNKSARLYRITISAIDRPGGSEVRSRPGDGELLFAPRQLTLQAGESEYFKFYYHGPRDNRERYYRSSAQWTVSLSVSYLLSHTVHPAGAQVVNKFVLERSRSLSWFNRNVNTRRRCHHYASEARPHKTHICQSHMPRRGICD